MEENKKERKIISVIYCDERRIRLRHHIRRPMIDGGMNPV